MLIIGLSIFVFGLFMLLESLHIVSIMSEVYFSAFIMFIGVGIIYEVLSRRCQRRYAIVSTTGYCHPFEQPDEQKERKQAEKQAEKH